MVQHRLSLMYKMEELSKEEIEKLAVLRNSMMSPYIAQGWEVKADYPNERRLVLKRTKKLSIGWSIFWFIFYIIPFFIYLLIWYLTKDEEKTLLY